MFNQYFGNYLLEKKIIKPEVLKIVLEEQKSAKVKLGVMAIDSGYMTAVQVNSVHNLQITRDKKFGELAIAEGYLTEEMLDNLLKAQKKSNVLLGQVLIEKGYFTFEKYEEILTQYNVDSGFTQEEIKALKNNEVDKIVDVFLKGVNPHDYDLYHDYIELFIRNIVRFIDNEIMIEEVREIDSYTFSHIVTQKMDGQFDFFTGFAGLETTMARFASIYAKVECNTMDAIAKDSLSEFMNCQNGLFLSNLSHNGVELELYPCEVKENSVLKDVEKMYKVPCNLSFGKIDLIFRK